MTRRELLMSWALGLLVGGLFLGTSAGRAALAEPLDVGIQVPRWSIWAAALVAHSAASLLPSRAIRVLIGFAAAQAFLPLPIQSPLPWSRVQEAGVFLLVLLSDIAWLSPRSNGPDRPRRTPAAALRQFVYSMTTVARERRRIARAR
jgi:hypothetical protein